jgi:hypothetical protein
MQDQPGLRFGGSSLDSTLTSVRCSDRGGSGLTRLLDQVTEGVAGCCDAAANSFGKIGVHGGHAAHFSRNAGIGVIVARCLSARGSGDERKHDQSGSHQYDFDHVRKIDDNGTRPM